MFFTMSEVFQYVKTQWAECGRTLCCCSSSACSQGTPRVSNLHDFMIGLAGCVVCSNGAGLKLWGSLAPIVLRVINCNYTPQTCKRGLGAVVEVFASVADKRVRKTFRELLKLKQAPVGSEAAVAATVPNVQTVSEDDPAVCSVPPMADVGAHVPDSSAATTGKRAADSGTPLALWSIAYLGGTLDR